MKQSSGIYRSTTNNDIFIIFGGKIALSLAHDNEHLVLIMNELKESINIGDFYNRNDINKQCPSINLLFNDIKSINVVIEYLEKLKKYFNSK